MKLKQVLLTAVISAVVSVCSIFVYDRFFSQKIVTFDLKGYVATLQQLYLTKQIDDAELKKRIDEIEKIVLTTPKRKVIITSDVILGGERVENLTPKINVKISSTLPEKQDGSTEGTSK